MEIENLKTFLTLSRLKNFTQTADEHFVVQSTVTNRIFELEKELGQKLFVRDKKSVSLTEAGNRLIPYAKRMIELDTTLKKEMSSCNTYLDVLHIGTTNTIYDCYLCPVLANYMKCHPQIATKVSVEHSTHLFQSLQDGSLDIIFSYLPYHKRQYSCTPFKQDTLVLVTHPHNTDYLAGIYKKDLPNLPYLYCDFVFEEGESFIRDLFPSQFIFPFEIDRSTKLIYHLLQGIGYSFLPRSLVQAYFDEQKLIEIPLLDFNAPIIQSYVICKEQTLTKESIAAFLSLL